MNIGEALEADWQQISGALRRHLHASAAQPAATANIEPTTGGPVSLAADLHGIAARLEHYDDETLQALDAVKANPATADAFAILRDLAGFNVSPDFITLATAVLTELRNRLAAAAQQQAAPAGPLVAGQA